jgi:hypothetical protein
VWQDDIEEAERLKKYYRERMVVEALKSSNGVNRSQFRQKLAKLVVNELLITKKEIGLLCRLPYFYEEDQALDGIVAETNDTKVEGTSCHAYSGEFLPLQRILVSRASGDYYHYWFTDAERTPYNFVIKTDNPLRSMFESMYNQGPMHLNANIYPKSMRGCLCQSWCDRRRPRSVGWRGRHLLHWGMECVHKEFDSHLWCCPVYT